MQEFYPLFSHFNRAITRHIFNLACRILDVENLIHTGRFPGHKPHLVCQHEARSKHMEQKPILEVLHSKQRYGPWQCPWLLIVIDEQELVAQERHQVKYETIQVQNRHAARVQLDDEHRRHQPWVRLLTFESLSRVQKLKVLLNPNLWVWLVAVLIFGVLFQIHLSFSVNQSKDRRHEPSSKVLWVDNERTHEYENADVLAIVHIPLWLKALVDFTLCLVWEQFGFHSDPIKTRNEHNDSHVNELLDENHSEASLLLFIFGVLLLEFAKLLVQIGNVLVDEHSRCRNEEKRDLLDDLHVLKLPAIVGIILATFWELLESFGERPWQKYGSSLVAIAHPETIVLVVVLNVRISILFRYFRFWTSHWVRDPLVHECLEVWKIHREKCISQHEEHWEYINSVLSSLLLLQSVR